MGDKSFNELEVYTKAHNLANEIHDLMGLYDDEEFEDIVDEVRHSSRQVVKKISDAWTNRHFMSTIEVHLNGALAEANHVIKLLTKAREDKLLSEVHFDKKVQDYLDIQHDLMEIVESGKL